MSIQKFIMFAFCCLQIILGAPLDYHPQYPFEVGKNHPAGCSTKASVVAMKEDV